MGRVVSRPELAAIAQQLRAEGKRIVFTNGCFDILHRGHVDYLNRAKALGDVLVVGLNTDHSVNRIKGPSRPIVNEEDRSYILANLVAVDFTTLFDEETPWELIKAIVPHVLVKGGDWTVDKIIGRDIVEAAGGTVLSIPFTPDHSTTSIIQKILATS